MNCKQCGFPIGPEDQFCKNCGTKVPAESTVVQESVNQVVTQNTGIPITEPVQTTPVIPVETNVVESVTPVVEPASEPAPQPSIQPQVQNDNQKPNNAKYIITGVLAVAIVTGAFIFAKTMNIQKNAPEPEPKVVEVTKDYNVVYKNFKMNVPGDLVFEKENGSLYIYDEEENWVAVIDIEQMDYDSIKNNKDKIKESVEKKGYSGDKVKEKTIETVEYITIELSKNLSKSILAYTKLNSTHTMVITAYTVNNDQYDYKILERLNKIVQSAEYDESIKGILEKQGIKIGNIFDTNKSE